jgi:hypothetical protein
MPVTPTLRRPEDSGSGQDELHNKMLSQKPRGREERREMERGKLLKLHLK